MVKVFMELTARKSGLTQVGYLKREVGKVVESHNLIIPFSIVDDFLAEEFATKVDAIKAVNTVVGQLNFGYFKGVNIMFTDNERSGNGER